MGDVLGMAGRNTVIYLIGSLRNPRVPRVAAYLRSHEYEVFDDWYAAGPEADDYWQAYETQRGHTYAQALQGYAAKHVYHYDLHHLQRADIVILLLPVGKSGHLEFGWALGTGKPGYICLDTYVPDRYDVMYCFATAVCHTEEDLLYALQKTENGDIYDTTVSVSETKAV